MEHRIRAIWHCGLDWICQPFGLTAPSGPSASRNPAKQPRDGSTMLSYHNPVLYGTSIHSAERIQAFSAASTMALDQDLSLLKKPSPAITIENNLSGLAQQPTAGENNEIEGRSDLVPEYTYGPDRAIVVKDNGRDCVALLLSEETVRGLVDIIVKRKAVQAMAQTYQEVSFNADLGEGFLNYFPTMLEGATSQEECERLKSDLERRRPDILRDIKRRDHLKTEYEAKCDDLKYLRIYGEDKLEEVLRNAQLIQQNQDGGETGVSEIRPNSVASDYANTEEQQNVIIRDQSGDLDPLEEVEQARQNLLDIQNNFDYQRDAQEQEVTENRQLQQQGVATFSDSELDLLHIQQRAQTTRALIEAEEAYEMARSRALQLGVLQNYPDQESGFADRTDDGLSEYDDFVVDDPNLDHGVVRAWAEKVAGSQDQEDVYPEVDDWDSRSITMSESVSVCADGKWRVRINRWQNIQDSARDGLCGGDTGALAMAVMTGELQLSRE